MSRKFRQIGEVLALVDRGDKAAEISDANNALITRLQDHAGPKGKAKGKMTIEIEYEVEGHAISISVTHKIKEPAPRKSLTHMFVDPEGLIVTEHPRQIPMFPHDVAAERASS